MTEMEAIYTFFSGFGLPAYPETAVPPDAALPYLTFESKESWFGDGPVSLGVYLWYYTPAQEVPSAKALEIGRALDRGGVLLPCDGGAIWLQRGTPWCLSRQNQKEPRLQQRVLNVTAEFLVI